MPHSCTRTRASGPSLRQRYTNTWTDGDSVKPRHVRWPQPPSPALSFRSKRTLHTHEATLTARPDGRRTGPNPGDWHGGAPGKLGPPGEGGGRQMLPLGYVWVSVGCPRLTAMTVSVLPSRSPLAPPPPCQLTCTLLAAPSRPLTGLLRPSPRAEGTELSAQRQAPPSPVAHPHLHKPIRTPGRPNPLPEPPPLRSCPRNPTCCPVRLPAPLQASASTETPTSAVMTFSRLKRPVGEPTRLSSIPAPMLPAALKQLPLTLRFTIRVSESTLAN